MQLDIYRKNVCETYVLRKIIILAQKGYLNFCEIHAWNFYTFINKQQI